MKRTIPAKTVEVCDFCQRDPGGILMTCLICGKEFCWSCRGVICGCMVDPDLCRGCANRDDVRNLVQRFAELIVPIIERRTAALQRLGRAANSPAPVPSEAP